MKRMVLLLAVVAAALLVAGGDGPGGDARLQRWEVRWW